MKNILHYCLAIVCLYTISSCSTEEPAPNNTNNNNTGDTLKVADYTNPPCTTNENRMMFNGVQLDFYSVMYTDKAIQYGNYGMRASSTNGDLQIAFKYVPVEGVYMTTDQTHIFDLDKTECIVSATVGSPMSYQYLADSDQKIYVKKLGDGKYKMEFCGLFFESGSTSGTFTTDGNLTVD